MTATTIARTTTAARASRYATCARAVRWFASPTMRHSPGWRLPWHIRAGKPYHWCGSVKLPGRAA